MKHQKKSCKSEIGILMWSGGMLQDGGWSCGGYQWRATSGELSVDIISGEL